ncbi:hypothetical protein P378_09590 [Desulforamulus profundi]|uniref:NAD-dependent epimerase/dehydratase domain-containing protein n=1 Tax=Desulforamulus profundi TaxID=1383067 RepID=A0A2C6LIY6_9FIRM|nr:hypothetical protein P378_09590 [Desulforamulus profundi]
MTGEKVAILAVTRSRGSQTPDNADITYSTADILDYTTLHHEIRRSQPEIVFHLAGVRPRGRSWGAIQQAYQTNLMGTMKGKKR